MQGRSCKGVALFDVSVSFFVSFAVLAVPFVELLLGGEQETGFHGRSSERTMKSRRDGNVKLILNFIGGGRT